MRTKPALVRIWDHLIPTILSVALSSVAPALYAQSDKGPYSVIIFEGGGGVLSPRNSSATGPTQTCYGGFITFSPPYNCAEQFSRSAYGGFGMGVRPIRYLQADLRADILGDFNGYQSFTAPYKCVTGCTGVVSETINTLSGLITLNGQGVLPLFHEHLLISAGGGIGWLEVRSHAQTGGVQVQGGCPSCPAPQGGHGPTEVAEIMYLPNQHFGIGLQVRNVQISSPGLSPVAGPFFGPITYKDRFLLIGAQITVRVATHH